MSFDGLEWGKSTLILSYKKAFNKENIMNEELGKKIEKWNSPFTSIRNSKSTRVCTLTSSLGDPLGCQGFCRMWRPFSLPSHGMMRGTLMNISCSEELVCVICDGRHLIDFVLRK